MGIIELSPPPHVEFVKVIKHQVKKVKVDEIDKTLLEALRERHVLIHLKDITVPPDELIEIRGRKACVYIRDQKRSVNFYRGTSEYRYHLCNCSTLQKMKRMGRQHRYLATQRNDGRFEVWDVYMQPPRRGIVKLELCMNCIQILRYKSMYRYPFDLKDFFKRYDSDVPKNIHYVETVTDIQTYQPNQDDISREYKKAVNYICQMCRVDCKTQTNLLHLHHVDGNPSNNTRYNLFVLCVECHSKQPLHDHMRSNPKFVQKIREIESLRKEQGLAI